MLYLPGIGQGLVHDADGDFDAGSDGADGFPALAAGEDGGALVVVDDGATAADAAPAPGCFEAALDERPGTVMPGTRHRGRGGMPDGAGRQPGAGQLAGQLTVRGAGPCDHRAPGIVPAAVRGSAAAGRPGPYRAPGRRRGAGPAGRRPARRVAVLPPPTAPGPGRQRLPAVRAPPAVVVHAPVPPPGRPC